MFTLGDKRRIKKSSTSKYCNWSSPSKIKNKISIKKVKEKCKTFIHSLKSSTSKPKISQSETTETESESDDDDDDPEYVGYGDIYMNENEEKKEIGHLQYSLIIFPKLLTDNATRTYITKQVFFIGNGFMPFKRSDINDLIPKLFEKNKNQRYLKDNFIKNLEKDYGNEKRKKYFYDRKYEKREKEFTSFEPKGK